MLTKFIRNSSLENQKFSQSNQSYKTSEISHQRIQTSPLINNLLLPCYFSIQDFLKLRTSLKYHLQMESKFYFAIKLYT